MTASITPYDAFRYFNSIRLHFSSETYDCVKYQFKASNVSPKSFMKRKDKYQYAKLAKKFANSGIDLVNYIVANIVYSGNGKWVGDLLNPESETTYQKWLSVNESLTYVFKKDINSLSEYEFNEVFITQPDQTYPVIVKKFLQGSLQIETLVILNAMTGFVETEDKNIKDPVVWPDVKKLIQKYTPFVNFNQEKCKDIVISSFTFNS